MTPTPQDKEQELAEALLTIPRDEKHKPLLFTLDELVEFITARTALAEVEARKDENDSMKESVRHGYSQSGHCHNHDKFVGQCHACQQAKWGNIFAKKYEEIVDERLADLESQAPLLREHKGKEQA